MSSPNDASVIVIGSGIGGLCCGALLARYGFKVTVCESHTIPGGAAHGIQHVAQGVGRPPGRHPRVEGWPRVKGVPIALEA
ncbi:MAG: FAD-dependent oxidoreductase, partial [Cyanobacteria bacterium J06638_6]